MQDFTKLNVWKKAHDLAVTVYRVTWSVKPRDFPGLVSQLRRAATSIPANIAEGCGHRSRKEFGRFLQIAMASAFELEYHFILAGELGLLPVATCEDLLGRIREIKRMLAALTQRVNEPGAGSRERQAPSPPEPDLVALE
jgi:four helix bundle protein